MNTPTAPDPTGATTPAGMLALWITADGGIASVTLPADDIARAQAMAELVTGGVRLAVIGLDPTTDMWFDGAGPEDHPANTVATRVARHYGQDRHPHHGPALFLAGPDHPGADQENPDEDGTDHGLDRTGAALLTELAFHAAHEGPLRPEETDGSRHRALYG